VAAIIAATVFVRSQIGWLIFWLHKITNHSDQLNTCELLKKCLMLEIMYWLVVDSSWNVKAHGDAREGKWRGIWWMQWVGSTLHTTSEYAVSSITTADAHSSAVSSRLNWRPPADLNGQANAVGSQYSSHYLRTWCIQHYYRWCRTIRLPVVDWNNAPPPKPI